MRRYVKFATSFRVFFATLLISQVVEAQEKQPAYQPPLFRTTEEQARPALPEQLAVKLIADEDFAPYSFRSRTGSPAGISVEIAIAACEQARLACTVEVRPYAEILPALERGEVDVAVTGPRLDANTLAASRMTRPYFRIMGRFAVPNTSTLDTASVSNLAGRRIGVVKDTVHARWLTAYYASTRITPFDDLAAAGAALKGGQVDALFGDNLQVIYWVAGEAASGCCRLLGGAYSDFDYFSRNLAFLARRDKPELAQALDYGLDKAQAAGSTAKILRTYLPLDPW
jgi:polar amino acid transport system substrate-binding protein